MEHIIENIKAAGFTPIAYCTMLCEDTFVFETDDEAQRAFTYFEYEGRNIQGWWYGIEEFKDTLRDYESKFGKVNVTYLTTEK